jgi:cytoskeleton protein RodZ
MQNDTAQNPLELPDADANGPTESPLIPTQPDLKAAREARRLSVGDAAYALKVSPRVIDAMEAGQWADLPGRTFAVGILRAYGRLLEISVDALVDGIPGATTPVKKAMTSNLPSRAAKPTTRRDGEAKRQTHRMLKSGVMMMAVAVVLAYVVPADFWSGALESAQSLYERIRGGQAPSPSVENPVIAPAASNEQSSAPAVPTVEQQASTGTGTLELRFAAPAWVEVRDYTGRIIYSQLNAAGSTQFVTGAAPLDIMIGNAKQVQARWRDEPIKLDKLSGDDVARQVLR